MKIVCIVIPAKSHMNPILGVVKALVQKGHEVLVYSTPDYALDIKASGAKLKPIPLSISSYLKSMNTDAFFLTKILIEVGQKLIPQMIAMLEKDKPDLVINDSLCYWGKIATQKCGVLTITVVTTMALTPRILMTPLSELWFLIRGFLLRPMQSLSLVFQYYNAFANHKLRAPFIADLFSNKQKLNIVFTSRQFQPHGKSFEEEYAFVGPITYKRIESVNSQTIRKDKPIILISMGTIYNDLLPFYRFWIDYFRDKPYQIYLSVGSQINLKDLGNLPEHIIAAQYLPQLDILALASLFISHGGMNSVNESMYYGVPMLLFPQIHEQKINASRVHDLHAGIWYRRPLKDNEVLDKTIHSLLTNSVFQRGAKKCSDSMKKAGGIEKAVSLIEGFANMSIMKK